MQSIQSATNLHLHLLWIYSANFQVPIKRQMELCAFLIVRKREEEKKRKTTFLKYVIKYVVIYSTIIHG